MKERLVRGGMEALAGTIFCRLLHAATYFILARLLIVASFGEMGLATIAINALALFPALGMGTALLAGREDPRKHAPAALTVSLGVGVTLSLIALGVSVWIGDLYGTTVGHLVAVIGLTLACRSISAVTSAVLDRELRFRDRVLAECWGALAFMIVAVSFALAGMGSLSIGWGLVAGASTTAVIQGVMTKLKPAFSKEALRRLSGTVRFGGIVLVTTILNWVFVSADPLLIEHRFGVEGLGFYTLAVFLAMQPANALGILSGRLALPAMVRARDEGRESKKAFLASLRLAVLIAACATAMFTTLSGPLVALFYGTDYAASSGLVAILTFYAFARVLGGFAGPCLLANQKATWALGLVIVQDLIALPLAWFLPRSFGAEGIAWVFTATALGACGLALVLGMRLQGAGLKDLKRAVLVPLILVVGPGMIGRAMFGDHGGWVGLGVGLAWAVYGIHGQWMRLGLQWPRFRGEAPCYPSR